MVPFRSHGFFVAITEVRRNAPRMGNLKTPVGRVRSVGILEGISFLLLMGIAMPLKYLADIPEAVKYTGWAHGILFILYVLAIVMALAEGSLSFKKAVLAFIASLLPFGPFLIDRKLAEEETKADRVS